MQGLKVDVLAGVAGVHCAYNNGRISKELFNVACCAFGDNAKKNDCGRMDSDYKTIMEGLVQLESFPPLEVAALWEELGRSIRQGIKVAITPEIKAKSARSSMTP